jgi:hypothetical protein
MLNNTLPATVTRTAASSIKRTRALQQKGFGDYISVQTVINNRPKNRCPKGRQVRVSLLPLQLNGRSLQRE